MSENKNAELSAFLKNESFEIIYSHLDEKFVLLKQEMQNNFRPYLHPIRFLEGSFVITENSPSHHPWQHGLYFGLHGVNGSDFWKDSGERVGSFQDTKLEKINVTNAKVTWSVSTHWVHHNGEHLIKEIQEWSLIL